MLSIDGHVLAESGAILEYLAERTGSLRPATPDDLREYRFFLHYAEGSAMPPLLVSLIFSKMRAAPVPFFIRPIVRTIAAKVDAGYTRPALDLHFGFVEETLGARPWFAGAEISMADIQMLYPVEAALQRAGGDRPNMQAWLERVKGRAAYQRAEEKGGPALHG